MSDRCSQRWGYSLGWLKASYSTEARAKRWLKPLLWPRGPRCPHCGSARVKFPPKPTRDSRTHYCCECQCYFGLRTGTVMQYSKLSYRIWVIAMHLVAHPGGISSAQLHRDLNITQATAWNLLRRLRNMQRQKERGCVGIPNGVRRGEYLPQMHDIDSLDTKELHDLAAKALARRLAMTSSEKKKRLVP